MSSYKLVSLSTDGKWLCPAEFFKLLQGDLNYIKIWLPVNCIIIIRRLRADDTMNLLKTGEKCNYCGGCNICSDVVIQIPDPNKKYRLDFMECNPREFIYQDKDFYTRLYLGYGMHTIMINLNTKIC